ncbi:MAG: hypothetical protein ACFHX7_24275 [Pseudomonadota bacterium]
MKSSKRKVKNLVVFPKFQLRLCSYFAISGLAFFAVVMGFAFVKLAEVRNLMNNNPEMDFQVQMQVNDAMFSVIQTTLAGFVLYIIFTSVFALIVSHRIAGPVVAIVAFIDELKRGNYEYRRKLRPRDELNEIMDGLNELGPLLKERESGG